MESRRDYLELTLTFKNVLFEWEKYEAKAWYVYEKERNTVKDFLDKNSQIAWMKLDNTQGGKLAIELRRELYHSHALYDDAEEGYYGYDKMSANTANCADGT